MSFKGQRTLNDKDEDKTLCSAQTEHMHKSAT